MAGLQRTPGMVYEKKTKAINMSQVSEEVAVKFQAMLKEGQSTTYETKDGENWKVQKIHEGKEREIVVNGGEKQI